MITDYNVETFGDVWLLIYSISAHLSNFIIYYFLEEHWNFFVTPYEPDMWITISKDLIMSPMDQLNEVARKNNLSDMRSVFGTLNKAIQKLQKGNGRLTESDRNREELYKIKTELERYMKEGARKCTDYTPLSKINLDGLMKLDT